MSISAREIRLIDIALALGILAVAAGLCVRACHEDRVAKWMTDLSKREDLLIAVAVPNPWMRPPLSELPVSGDSEVGEGGRDIAWFQEICGETLPVAVFRVRARVDSDNRRWFNYGEILPGAGFTFRTDKYRIAGLIIDVKSGSSERRASSEDLY